MSDAEFVLAEIGPDHRGRILRPQRQRSAVAILPGVHLFRDDIGLLAHAARDSEARLALIGSFIFQFLVTLGCLIPSLKTGAPTGVALVAKLLQWNFGGLACYSLVWLALKRFIEPVEAFLPERAVLLQPIRGLRERLGFHAARTELRLTAARDEPRALEHAHVLGNGRQRHREPPRQLADRFVAPGKPLEDRAPRGVGERAERLGEQAHNLESQIERLMGDGQADHGQVLELQDAADALEYSFQNLQRDWRNPAPVVPAPMAVMNTSRAAIGSPSQSAASAGTTSGWRARTVSGSMRAPQMGAALSRRSGSILRSSLRAVSMKRRRRWFGGVSGIACLAASSSTDLAWQTLSTESGDS